MTRYFAMTLVAGAALLVCGPARAAEDPAFTDIKKQADMTSKKGWDDLIKDGMPVSKKHELMDVMAAFKPKNAKSGPGIGVDATNDGIEGKIISISRKPMEMPDLVRQEKELIRMAEISAAIASISNHQFPEKLPPGKKATAKDWTKWSRDMHDASQELIKAVKEKKPVDVKKAAAKLNNSCVICHAETRAGVDD